jgi:AcrR family transcriptional regulator
MGRIGKNKNEIIDCAIKIMDKKGLSSFQLSDVAEAMEMKTPSLYNHFDGLDDLIRAVQLRTNQLLYEFMLESAQGLKDQEAFRALCGAYRNFFKKHTGIYETMTISMNPKDKELLQATFKPVELVTNILTFIKMDTDLGVHIMRSIRCALHGFVSLEAKGNMILSTSADDSFNMLVDMLTESIWSKKRRMK